MLFGYLNDQPSKLLVCERKDFHFIFQKIFIEVYFLTGGKLKRRLRNILLISIVGFGTYHIYHRYQQYQWFNEMTDSDKTIGTKPRLVVLGTGADYSRLLMSL
jgi:hypothetical protein